MAHDDPANWWRDAVIYQVYIRSFADGDGDGLGDIAGIRSRLRYLADLGVDALWINPWYPSPMADAGYDVADYRAVEPRFGSLEDAEALLREAHEAGLRVLLDIVPNHTSDRHAWFVEALAAGPGSPARERYVFRPGRGDDGDLPPNEWQSVFGGPAWQRVTEPDGTPGEWYLHLFAPEQPDVNWEHPEVARRLREDPALLVRPGRRRLPDRRRALAGQAGRPARRRGPGVAPPAGRGRRRAAPLPVAAAPVLGPRRGARDLPRLAPHRRLLRPAPGVRRRGLGRRAGAAGPLPAPRRAAHRLQLHLPPGAVGRRLPAARDRARPSTSTSAVGAPATWVLSNHDVARHVSRYARRAGRARQQRDAAARPSGRPRRWAAGGPARRCCSPWACPAAPTSTRARSSGCPRSRTSPRTCSHDPTWERSGHTDRGRDGCRVPMPWSGTRPPYGFSPEGRARGSPGCRSRTTGPA